MFDDLLDRLDERGSAILISGDPGVGKTALLDEYARRAGAHHHPLVLRTSAAPSESAIPYSALQLLLQPLRAGIGELPSPQRQALEVAFGMVAGDPPPRLMTGLATLTLLVNAARQQPVLVLAEDLHWFDPASRSALVMAARRVAHDPVLVVITTRPMDTIEAQGITEHRLQPLNFIDSNALLDQRPDRPGGAFRRAILEVSAGNPLALLELSAGEITTRVETLAISRRLQLAFAGRYADLSDPARLLLLAAVLLDTESVSEATTIVAHALDLSPDPEWLAPAIAGGLIERSTPYLRFRHPLVRSAVSGASRPDERTLLLRTLVDMVAEPERTVWWRAELALTADAELAAELDDLSREALSSGDPGRAAAAMHRAATLTVDPRMRDERVVRAADAARLAGAYELAAQLTDRVIVETRSPGLRAHARWIRELLPVEEYSSLARGDLGPALAAIDDMRLTGEVDTALDALLHLASVAWNHSPAADPGRALAEAADRITLDVTDPRMLFLAAVTARSNRAEEVITQIRHHHDSEAADPVTEWYLGYALNLSGEMELAGTHLRRAVEGLRRHANLDLLPHALLGLSWICYLTGELAEGRAHVEEACDLAVDLNSPGLAAGARCARAWYQAIDGVEPDPATIAQTSDLVMHALDARDNRATLTLAGGMAALVSGRPNDAIRSLRRLTDPDDPAFVEMFAVVSLPDLVEAALVTDDRDIAQSQVDRLTLLHGRWHAPVVESVLRFADLALADEPAFRGACARLTADPLPARFFDARAHLHAGRRFRHMRRVADSRRHVHRALDLFEAFPADAWAQRCREELRATGERLPGATPSGKHVLTPQELRICELAATGLGNRAIAERLFLSPRTIGAHLYSAFRKLGITSREQLAEILA